MLGGARLLFGCPGRPASALKKPLLGRFVKNERGVVLMHHMMVISPPFGLGRPTFPPFWGFSSWVWVPSKLGPLLTAASPFAAGHSRAALLLGQLPYLSRHAHLLFHSRAGDWASLSLVCCRHVATRFYPFVIEIHREQ